MSEPTSLPAAVVADTIVRTVELGVTITDAAVDGDATVVFCDLLDDGRRHCPQCGGEGVYRDTVIRGSLTFRLWVIRCVFACGFHVTAAGAVSVHGKCSPTTLPGSHVRAGRRRGGAPATSCAG